MGPSAIRCVVFDFDGTLTDAEAMATAFEEGFRHRLAAVIGAGFEAAWSAAAATIGVESGWEIDRQIVAPALGDPYLRATWIARQAIAAASPARDLDERRAIVSHAYTEAYAAEVPRFKADAVDVVRAARARADAVFVVSNSPADAVRARLAAVGLDASMGLEVIGDARKFVIGEDTSPAQARSAFDAVAHDRAVPGLRRRILLRRGRYFAALSQAVAAARCDFDALLVCGDIFELDLALPAALGAAVQLVTRASTLEHERAAATAERRGAASPRLDAILDRLEPR